MQSTAITASCTYYQHRRRRLRQDDNIHLCQVGILQHQCKLQYNYSSAVQAILQALMQAPVQALVQALVHARSQARGEVAPASIVCEPNQPSESW